MQFKSILAIASGQGGGGAPSSFDTSIGNGVDVNGYADLPLKSGAKYIFVGSGGNDGNTGLSHAQRLATLAAAKDLITQGAGDQMLIAEGSSFSTNMPNMNSRDGFSAVYPTVVQSYDPNDPTNTALYGKATANRPVINTGANSGNIMTFPATNYMAFRGLKFNPGNVADMSFPLVNANDYILFENIVFAYTGASLDTAGAGNTNKMIFRKCSSYGQWSATDHSQGIYVDNCLGLTIEDCVFYHNGWKVGSARTDTAANGGATVFRHSIYSQSGSTLLARRNVFIDPSATGISARDGVTAYDNILLDCPINFVAGLADVGEEDPDGVLISIYNNAILGDADVNGSSPGGAGFASGNGINGSSIHHNLVAGTRGKALNQYVFNNEAKVNQPSYMLYDRNLILDFSDTIAGNGGNYPAQVFSTFTNNTWDAAASGSNVNNSGYTGPNMYADSTELATAAGYASRQAMIDDMISHPENNNAATLKTLLGTGYAMTWS